jgi:hypothetical protein
MHYEILDDKRRALLPALHSASDTFYLAGGTGLALQLGHRDSIDFDLFCDQSFDTQKQFARLSDVLAEHSLLKTQDERDTLTVVIDNEVKVSFFGYPYPLLMPLLADESFKIASTKDIGCMKLSAITSRATKKDYVDLYYVFKQHSLKELLESCRVKYPTLEHNLILKSVLFFDDVVEEPIRFMPGYEVSFATIRDTLTKQVRSYQLGV